MLSSHRRVKPWPGVGIDWDQPLCQGLQIAIPFNEGSGSPYELVNNVAPLTVSNLGWASGADGWQTTYNGSSTKLLYPAPEFNIATGSGMSVLWRGLTTSLSSGGCLVERGQNNLYWCLIITGGAIILRGSASSPRATWTISGINTGALNTFVATDNAVQTNNMYVNGVLVSATTNAAHPPIDSTSPIAVGYNYNANNEYLTGAISLILVWNRVLSGAEVASISANPWQIFRPAWSRGLVIKSPASFVVTESELPTHHAGGSVTVHAVGTGTTWTTGTTFSCTGVSGWSVASATIVDSTHATLSVSCPSSGGSTGSLTFATGSINAVASVSAPLISASPATISPQDTVTVTLTGTSTLWLDDTPTFTISGGTGATIGTPSFTSNTSATVTVYAGTAPGATLTFTDPSTGATTTASVSDTVLTTAYVSKSGGLVFFAFSNSSNQPQAVTAMAGNPTINVNGSPVSCLGPFWTMITQRDPFVVYQLETAVTSGETVTFAASAGWVTTTGGAATFYDDGPVANYTGQIEPALFGYPAFGSVPSNTSGMQLSLNQSPASGIYYAYNFNQNWLKRASWTGLGTLDSNGHPETITASNGQAQGTIANFSEANYVDNRNMPDLCGTWTFVADETDPSSPMTCYLYVASGAATITSGPTTASAPNYQSGTLISGVQTGEMWQWVVTRKSGGSQLNLDLILVVCTPSGAAGNWTLTNERMIAPIGDGGPAPSLSVLQASTANGVGLDQNNLNWLQLANNKGPAALRFLTTTGYNGGQSNAVDPADLRNLADFTWNTTQSWRVPQTSVTVTTMRPYSLSTSPNVYVSSPYPNATANSGVTPPSNVAYYYTPSSTGWIQISGAYEYQAYTIEFVTATDHGLKTGQIISFTYSGSVSYTVTNGSNSPVTLSFPAPSNGTQWTLTPCFVTSPTSFVVRTSSSSLTSQTGYPINTLDETINPSSMTVTAALDPSTTPYEICAALVAAIPGCGLWITIPCAFTDATCTDIFTNRILPYLATGQKLYIEYGNEDWNTSYQNLVFNWYMGQLTGIPLTGGGGAANWDWFVQRSGAIHQLAIDAFVAAGRASTDVVCIFGSQAVTPGVTTDVVASLNNWNTNYPSDPIRCDAIHIAPYIGCPVDVWPNPTSQATVNATGGGSSGGSLAAGKYFVDYTYVDKVSGYETSPGYGTPNGPSVQATVNVTGGGTTGGSLPGGTYYACYTYVNTITGRESNQGSSESTQFTVSSGDIPQVTFNDTLPLWASGRNLYVTLAGGASGSEIKYASGIANSTYNLAASNAGSTASGFPTGSGTSTESNQFTVSSGNIPQVTFTGSLPSWASGRNIYLTATGGGPGTEVRYATNVSTSTYNLSAANTGSAAFPLNSRVPSYTWAAASMAAGQSTCIANTSLNPGNPYASNPWSYGMWCDFMRHDVLYNLSFGGPSQTLGGVAAGYFAAHTAAIQGYNKVSGQTAMPLLYCYEAAVQNLIPYVLNYTPTNNPSVYGYLTHDVMYWPDFYLVENAYYWMMSYGGVSMANIESLCFQRLQGSLLSIWCELGWAGQKPGRGDNSDGKGTNQFSLSTTPPTAYDVTNVAVRFQAWQDWAQAGNVTPQAQMASLTSPPIIRSRATRERRGRLLLASRMPTLQPQVAPLHSSQLVRCSGSRARHGVVLIPSRTPTPQPDVVVLRGSAVIRSSASRTRRGIVLLHARTPTPQIHLIASPMMVRTNARRHRGAHTSVPTKPIVFPVAPSPSVVQKRWFPGMSHFRRSR